MNGRHTFGYYVMWVGLGITLFNMVMSSWPLWVSLAGFGVSLFGMLLGYIEIGIRNRK